MLKEKFMNHSVSELNLENNITILGYSGSYLSLIFECLTALGFKGKVEIILNEAEKRAAAPFETNIPFTEKFYSDVSAPFPKGFTISSNKPSTKKFLFNFYKNQWGIHMNEFVNLIHPSSVVSSTVRMGTGLHMEPMSVIAPYANLGFGVNIGRNCSIGHHNRIGDFCSVYLGSNIAGHVGIAEETTIGPGCTIFSNIKIGSNTIIGGGSVVTRDMPSNVLAFGNPCQVVKSLV